jgi:hypothetical protein
MRCMIPRSGFLRINGGTSRRQDDVQIADQYVVNESEVQEEKVCLSWRCGISAVKCLLNITYVPF